MTTTRLPDIRLNDGTLLPAIALGTYNLRGRAGADAMAAAIRSGYRLLDSAFIYENEGAVGEALRLSGAPRDDVALTSKLPGRYHRYDDAVWAVEESLMRAGLDHWDLYLVHWPNPSQGLYVEAFQALVDLRERGLIRSVGVSNFLPEHLRAVADATGVVPAVNQIELHPYFPQSEQIELHRKMGVVTEAWSPLARKLRVVDDPTIRDLADEVGRAPAQVVLRWHYQRGVVPLPKSASPERQASNLDIADFELTDDQMARISSLGRPDGRQNGQDPAVYEEF
ncbi:aldo/keto reductase [Actinomyces sp. B33]|uniref:aldo/keto reductase n=1 Tax=Actinomyces sp. B33 TaxID=2942131 RepID=UPI002340BB75|nr:aldo/keto reductase [Actinomyces sp. B33]MDC4232272.1 aldo/keto reductase [Actinomyces sp. B33]